MNKINELSSSVQNLAKSYSAVIQLGEYLSGLSSVENLACEIEARIERARSDEKEAVAAKAKAETTYAAERAKGEGDARSAREAAEELLTSARAQAQGLVAAAKIAAQQIIDAAEARKAEAEMETAVLIEEDEHLSTMLNAKQRQLDELRGSIAALRAKLG